MSSNKNVKILRLVKFCTGLVFILPVAILYYRDVIGIGFQEFLWGEAGFAAVIILMEVPSGWLSDIWKRKHILLLGEFFAFIGFVLLFCANSFSDAFISQCLLGVGVALISGTDSALLYESLLEHGKEKDYRRLQGLQHGSGFYAVAIASVIGGFSYQIHPHLPVALTALSTLLAFIAILFIVEPERQKKAVEQHPLADMLATVRYALHGHAEIGAVILLSAILFTTTKIILWAQQSYYISLSIPESWFGILIAAGFLLGGLGGHFGHIIDRRVNNRYILSGLLVFAFLICFISGLAPGYHGVALLLLGSLIFGFGKPHVDDYINKRVDSTRRATIISTASLMVSLLFIPCSALMGWFSDEYSIYAALLAQAVLLALLGGGSVIIISLRNGRLVKN